MNILMTIVQILSVAFVVMFLYAWGYVKQQRQAEDLLKQLEIKAKKKILMALKKNGAMTKRELEGEVLNLKASLFFSKNKAIIKDPRTITETVINQLKDSGIIDIDNKGKQTRYILK